jgi:hypothetical protein
MDSGKRIVNFLLVVGMCGFVKGFDKELEKDSLVGIENSGSTIFIEKGTDFLHTKISLEQPVLGLMNLDHWISEFNELSKSKLDMVMANYLRKQHTNLVQKLETIVGL